MNNEVYTSQESDHTSAWRKGVAAAAAVVALAGMSASESVRSGLEDMANTTVEGAISLVMPDEIVDGPVFDPMEVRWNS